MSKIRIGTRRSPLAVWQAKWVAEQLALAEHQCELVPMDTRGDRMLNVSIPEIGSKGVFTVELEQELLRGNIDLAVHSAKDMPSELPVGFELIAFTPREEAHDVLVSYHRQLDMNGGLLIGTSSTRRVALFQHYYPNFKTTSVRGNLQTRLKKLKTGSMDALALAYAGVHRLGLNELVRYSLPLETFTPAVGQGCMAIEAHRDLDQKKRALIRKIVNHEPTERCLLAERAFLSTIQGGCSIPAFALARLKDKLITITGGLISLDGKQMIRLELSDNSENAVQLGKTLATEVLNSGGAEILVEIKSKMKKTP
jgi:hydroxymethylbilane synthase